MTHGGLFPEDQEPVPAEELFSGFFDPFAKPASESTGGVPQPGLPNLQHREFLDEGGFTGDPETSFVPEGPQLPGPKDIRGAVVGLVLLVVAVLLASSFAKGAGRGVTD